MDASVHGEPPAYIRTHTRAHRATPRLVGLRPDPERMHRTSLPDFDATFRDPDEFHAAVLSSLRCGYPVVVDDGIYAHLVVGVEDPSAAAASSTLWLLDPHRVHPGTQLVSRAGRDLYRDFLMGLVFAVE